MVEGRNDEDLQVERIARKKAKRDTIILMIALLVALILAYLLNSGLAIVTILLVLLIIFVTCIITFYVLKKTYIYEEIEKIEEEN